MQALTTAPLESFLIELESTRTEPLELSALTFWLLTKQLHFTLFLETCNFPSTITVSEVLLIPDPPTSKDLWDWLSKPLMISSLEMESTVFGHWTLPTQLRLERLQETTCTELIHSSWVLLPTTAGSASLLTWLPLKTGESQTMLNQEMFQFKPWLLEVSVTFDLYLEPIQMS